MPDYIKLFFAAIFLCPFIIISGFVGWMYQLPFLIMQFTVFCSAIYYRRRELRDA